MNSRVGRLGGHSHDSRNLTFLFRSREATTHRVYLNEVDTPPQGFSEIRHDCIDRFSISPKRFPIHLWLFIEHFVFAHRNVPDWLSRM